MEKNILIYRIIYSVVLLISILFMPFWLSVILGSLGMIYFSFFFEAIALFFLSDLLYGVRETRLYNIVFISLIGSIIILCIIEILKKKIKFYHKI